MKRVARISLTVAVALSAGASFAQVTPQTSNEGVTVTGDARAEAFKKMADAERTAADARRMFSAGPGRDIGAACRKASEADREYAEAIRAAEQVAKDLTSPVKERTEERVKRVKDERENLDKLHDRFCRGGDIARPPAVRNAVPGRNRP